MTAFTVRVAVPDEYPALVELVLPRVVGTPVEAEQTLTGTWSGGEAVLAGLRRTTG